MSSQQIDAPASANNGINRRTVVRAAAWSAPVIAAAIAVPMASASTTPAPDPTIAALVGSTILANENSGTASGGFTNSGLQIANVPTDWSTGALTTSYRLQGPWTSGSITKPDGTPFVEGETIVHGGTTWTVVSVVVSGGVTRTINFSGAPVFGSSDMTILMPPAIYSGTFQPGTLDEFNPLLATVAVTAEEVNDGRGTTSSSGYPA